MSEEKKKLLREKKGGKKSKSRFSTSKRKSKNHEELEEEESEDETKKKCNPIKCLINWFKKRIVSFLTYIYENSEQGFVLTIVPLILSLIMLVALLIFFSIDLLSSTTFVEKDCYVTSMVVNFYSNSLNFMYEWDGVNYTSTIEDYNILGNSFPFYEVGNVLKCIINPANLNNVYLKPFLSPMERYLFVALGIFLVGFLFVGVLFAVHYFVYIVLRKKDIIGKRVEGCALASKIYLIISQKTLLHLLSVFSVIFTLICWFTYFLLSITSISSLSSEVSSSGWDKSTCKIVDSMCGIMYNEYKFSFEVENGTVIQSNLLPTSFFESPLCYDVGNIITCRVNPNDFNEGVKLYLTNSWDTYGGVSFAIGQIVVLYIIYLLIVCCLGCCGCSSGICSFLECIKYAILCCCNSDSKISYSRM